MLYQQNKYRISCVNFLSHSHSIVIGYCDILDVVTILSLPHGSHNIRYPVYTENGYFVYIRIIHCIMYPGLVLRSALIYATRLKKRRERYQGGIKALADQMNAIITSQGCMLLLVLKEHLKVS